MSENFRLAVKLTPKAKRNAMQGWAEGPEGQKFLRISVTAAPEKGRANEALIELLADHLDLPKRAFSLIRGQTDRLKIIEIEGVKDTHKALLKL